MDENVKYIVDIILKRINPVKIYLFGSRAKGNENTESDYDICILIKDKLNRNDLTMNIYKDLANFGKSVDIIIEYESEFNSNLSNKHLIYKDISEGNIVYA